MLTCIVYWPPGYYHSDGAISLEYDLEASITNFYDNTGNQTQDFTPYMYTNKAVSIPGSRNEKSLRMYLLERRTDPSFPVLNYEVHDGPEVILVKTAEFPSTTSASARASATSRYNNNDNDDDDDDDDDGWKRKRTAVIVIPTVIVSAFLIWFCFARSCCCKKGNGQRNVAASESVEREENLEPSMVHDRPIGVPATVPATASGNRVEVLPPYEEDAPPKYAP